MKLSECIEEVRQEKPNGFSEDKLTRFVNELEAMIQDYLGIDHDKIMAYEWENDGGKELIVQAPYDCMYKSYVKANIDYANEEYQSYANNQAQFMSDYEDWQAYAMRSDLVKSEMPQIKNWW